MLNIFNRFIDSNQKIIHSLERTVEDVNSLEKKYEKLKDQDLAKKFIEFQEEYKSGKTLDQLLPEVYAAVREAGNRTLKMRLFDVQLMAAISLHQGKIAEQKTGEGKTLSAVPALFLNAVSGKGVHLVTVNDYLAMRDCGWMSPVYNALGATSAVIVHEKAYIYDPEYKNTEHADPRLEHLKPVSRKEAYNADITYGTNNEYGFDYLKDNMVFSLVEKSQRGHYFAIVDEVDSILVDEARTPLIISRPAQEATDKYYEFARLMTKLDSKTDYVIDEKQRTSNLTEAGILKVEKLLGVDNLYEKDFSTLHHIEQALKARALFHKDKDYVVRDGEVIIVDEFTGRLMPGRRYSEGLHQAIEAKEAVPIQQESETLATISFQNYFRMYEKLAGMTGTASTEAEEFHKIYKLDVVIIPTHRPMARQDHPDMIYKTQAAKFNAVVNDIEQLHKKGQPVLVGTTSIEKNEILSKILVKRGISHALLNAKNHEKEAEIIAKAGEKGAVTVATNMAGRGVDIKLENNVSKTGGLFVIGTERHESRRIDNQLRGRSGRQGDPGASRFYVSLDDDIMRIFGGDQVAKIMDFLKIPEDAPIEHSMVSKAIESAQKKVEGHNFDIRKTTVEYDDVMNQQRQIIYGLRNKVLEAANNTQGNISGLKDDILEKISQEISSIVTTNSSEVLNIPKIIEDFTTIINFDANSVSELEKQLNGLQSTDQIINFLSQLARDLYEEREKEVGHEIARQMEIFVYLTTIDTLWIDHLDTMDDLRAGIGLRGFAQREPLVEYKKEGYELFEKLVKQIDYEIVHRIFKVSIQQNERPLVQTQPQIAIEQHPVIETGVQEEAREVRAQNQGQPLSQVLKHEGSATKVTIERNGQVVSQQVSNSNGQLTNPQSKIGRNDPCPCGRVDPTTGKPIKYKKCGLIGAPEHHS